MKKSILVVFAILVAASVGKSQATYNGSPYALEHHQKREALFKTEPIVTNKIVFLGDSITEFGDWRKLLDDPTIINRGIAGDTTLGVLNRLDDVIVRQPSKLFVKIGINDISKNVPDDVISENIFTIVKRVRVGSPKTKIFVHSILPTNDAVKAEYPDAFDKNDHVMAVNRQLKKYEKKKGYTFVDLCSQFCDEKGKLVVKYAENDGLHLNADGYALWVRILRKEKYL